MKIKKISALEILDSRGNPTVSAHVTTESGHHGYGMVPSGASTGSYEAVELRDGGERFGGKGVRLAVEKIEKQISGALCGIDVRKQDEIDRKMLSLDGTTNKEKLGANAMLAVSIACVRAASKSLGVEPFQYLGGFTADLLPLPMMNIINGGAHAANNLDIQEFMIVPVGAESFSEGLRMCAEIYQTLRKQLKKHHLSVSVGDEGGFAPDLGSHEAAIEHILDAVEKSGYRCGEDIKLALDAASSEWFDGEVYYMPKSKKTFSSEELITYWEDLAAAYPIISIEDPAAENDWETWTRILKRTKMQVVGDDLFVTQTGRLSEGIEKKAANAILIKPNQVGTVTETIEAVKLAKSVGFGTIVSHRSGDTEDSFIADLAVGLGAGQIKTGAPCRSERTAKYNRLLYIEKMLRFGI
ncbi:MAG: phosphopyruvate hydratase [Ruminococcaceae bacterium]|nr:phosphopyruvate hydratase [Oscillospiraceae bacterium]